MIKQVIR